MQAHFSNTSRSYLDFELRDETADFNQNRCSCQHDLPTPDYEYVNLPRDTSFHKYKQKTNQILVSPVGSLKISSSEFTLVAISGSNMDTYNWQLLIVVTRLEREQVASYFINIRDFSNLKYRLVVPIKISEISKHV